MGEHVLLGERAGREAHEKLGGARGRRDVCEVEGEAAERQEAAGGGKVGRSGGGEGRRKKR